MSVNGISFQLRHPQPVENKGIQLDCGYPIDVRIEDELIIELKAVEETKGIHATQLLTYLLAGLKPSLLINFNVTKLKDGIQRYVLESLRALCVLRGICLHPCTTCEAMH